MPFDSWLQSSQLLRIDHLGGTSVMSDSNGNQIGYISYFPFGATRSGSVPTDKKFTGQRLDETGLYYYNARYYDPNIGRFISSDSNVPDPTNPQALNRYSYVYNNPLKYRDPSGSGPVAGMGFSAASFGCGSSGYEGGGQGHYNAYTQWVSTSSGQVTNWVSPSPGQVQDSGSAKPSSRWDLANEVLAMLPDETTMEWTNIGDGYTNWVPSFTTPDGVKIGGLSSVLDLQQTPGQKLWGYRFAGFVREGPRGEAVPLNIVEPGSKFAGFMDKYLRGAGGGVISTSGNFS
jgi:RHS repeat-associated protein